MRRMTIPLAVIFVFTTMCAPPVDERNRSNKAPGVVLATIPMTRQIDFTSAINRHTYRIQIAIPLTPAPKGGFPVVYVLDGDVHFWSWSAAARMRAMHEDLAPAVIVGIGYPDSDNSFAVPIARRQYDMTPSPPDAMTKDDNPLYKQKDSTAGADSFFRVIQEEIRPRVAKVVPVSKGHDVLFGHSLGGLFVLHTLFKHPEAFHTWLALSPSIWWGDQFVFKEEPAFRDWVRKTKPDMKVFVGVGRLEGPIMEPPAVSLAKRLAALHGGQNYHVVGTVFDGATHIPVSWDALNAMLTLALPPDETAE